MGKKNAEAPTTTDYERMRARWEDAGEDIPEAGTPGPIPATPSPAKRGATNLSSLDILTDGDTD